VESGCRPHIYRNCLYSSSLLALQPSVGPVLLHDSST
jgi:hypothetical protein